MKRHAAKLLLPMFAGASCCWLALRRISIITRISTSTKRIPGSARKQATACGQTASQWRSTPVGGEGLDQGESGGDATVSAFGRTKNEQTLETYYNGFGGWGWRGFGGGETVTTVENTPVGSLVVDIFDGNSKHLIFRASSTDTLSSKPDKNEKKLEKAVEEMFHHFPPTKG